MRGLKKIFALGIALLSISMMGSWFAIEYASMGHIYTESEDIPKHRVGLLLGTTPRLADGRNNLFFLHRIEASVKLLTDKKIDYILVSGDNEHVSYNEPQAMLQALLDRDVPEDRIVLDYAGFRTLDSVIRAKEVFGQSSLTIISQPFHLKRALFLASHHGIDAVGFAASDVSLSIAPRVYVRELMARVKAVYDVMFGTTPRFLGEPVQIGL